MLRCCLLRPCTSSGSSAALTSIRSLAVGGRKRRYTAENDEEDTGQRRGLPIGAYVTLVIPASAFCLGVWQVRRLRWKLRLIDELKLKVAADPVPLPADLSNLDPSTWDYRRVTLTGRFDHTRELAVKPRRLTTDHKQGGLLSSGGGVGAHVVTPFVLQDGQEILVNRGWVPLADVNPKRRLAGQVEGDVTLTGVYRKSENRPQFVSKSQPERDHYTYRDVYAMARSRGTLPVYIEADKESSVAGGPVGGQTAVNPRNEHLQYIVTWWSLALITGCMWYVRFLRP